MPARMHCFILAMNPPLSEGVLPLPSFRLFTICRSNATAAIVTFCGVMRAILCSSIDTYMLAYASCLHAICWFYQMFTCDSLWNVSVGSLATAFFVFLRSDSFRLQVGSILPKRVREQARCFRPGWPDPPAALAELTTRIDSG